jgi:hypothetical protein
VAQKRWMRRQASDREGPADPEKWPCAAHQRDSFGLEQLVCDVWVVDTHHWRNAARCIAERA